MRIAIPLVLAGALAAEPEAASAQDTTRIPGRPTCAQCDIRAARRIVLGSFDGEAALFGQPITIVKDSKGFFYVSDASGGSVPFVFDSRGRFVRKLAGKGKGPGELSGRTALLMATGDTLHAIDFETGRRSLFSPAGEFIRMIPQPVFARFALVLPDGGLLLNGPGSDPTSIGTPLQIIDTTGRITRSFGGNHRVTPTDISGRLTRHLSRSRTGGVWAAHHNEYEFALWSTTGRLIRHYIRLNDFFRPNQRSRIALSPPYPPRISTVREDSTGLLWITIQVPVPPKEWEAALGKPGVTSVGVTWYPEAMRGRLFHTVVEVIDPRTGHLLVARRFPFFVIVATDDGEYAAYRQDGDGVPYVDIWRVQLVQP